jgi:integrase
LGTLEYLREKYKKQILSLQEVARELGLKKKEVQGLIDADEIVALNMGRKFMITLIALANFLESGEKNMVSGQQNDGLKLTEELSSSQANEEVTFWVDTQEGDDDVYTGSVTHTRGRYISQITIEKLPNGKRKRENKSFKSREEAERHLQTRLSELNNTKVNNKEQVKNATTSIEMTVREFVNYYLSLDLGKGTSRTKNGYKEDMRSIIDKIGDILITDITENDIRKLFNELATEYRQVVINKRWTTCKRIFKYAYKKKYIQNNVFEDLEKPQSRKINVEEEDYSAFTDEELDRIIIASKDHGRLYPILTVLKSTGMRPGELRGLLWKNFDPMQKTIRIVSAATRKYEKVKDVHKKAKSIEIISVPKSKYSKRILDLPDETVDALIEWRKVIDNNKNKKIRESQYIFPSRDGSFTKEAALRSLLARFIKKYDLKDTKLHQYKFRHTMCTRLILANIPISIIQRIMGDNTQDVIMKIYTHIYRDDVKEASLRFFEKENERYNESKQEKAS